MQTKQKRIQELREWIAFLEAKDIQTDDDRAQVSEYRRELYRLIAEVEAEGKAA